VSRNQKELEKNGLRNGHKAVLSPVPKLGVIVMPFLALYLGQIGQYQLGGPSREPIRPWVPSIPPSGTRPKVHQAARFPSWCVENSKISREQAQGIRRWARGERLEVRGAERISP